MLPTLSKKLITLNTILLAFVFANAQSVQNGNINTEYTSKHNRVFAPDTRNLNFVDAVALSTYCKLSKLFLDESKREKCFISDGLPNIPKTPASPFDSTQNVKSADIINLENKIDIYQKELESLKQLISDTNEESKTRVVNNTIVKYLNNRPVSNNATVIKNNSVATGINNKVSAGHAYVYGDSNTVYSNASNTLTLGANINNFVPGSVQIGLDDNTKLTILSTTTDNKNNGWVGLGGRTSPLNANTCYPSDTNCINNNELLRVPGKIVAKSFEVSGAADLAENFTADEEGLEAGYIVEFGERTHTWNSGGSSKVSGDYQVSGVVKARSSKNAIGVIATNPGVILGGGYSNTVPVAFSGRVPVRVSNENGEIKKGDKIRVSNSKPGVGAKAILDGNVIGTALSDANGEVVLMLVKNEYVNSNALEKQIQSQTASNSNENKLCIDNSCIDKNILEKVINFFKYLQ